jgi:hypothetical protein
MQLVINTYGAYLRKSGNCFLVKREDKSFEAKARQASGMRPSRAHDLAIGLVPKFVKLG